MKNFILKFIFFTIVSLYTVLIECPPAGLQNLGNTCYMNATLQALFACKPLNTLCMRYDVTKDIAKNNSYIDQYALLLKEHQQLESGHLAPTAFSYCMQADKIFGRESVFQQQDASEFLKLLIEKMSRVEPSDSSKEKEIKQSIAAIFEFDIKNVINCERNIKNFESSRSKALGFEISLPEQLSDTGLTLKNLFNHGRTPIENPIGAYCPVDRNKNGGITEKWSEIATAPQILMITLNRFYIDLADGERKKNSAQVIYDLDPLAVTIAGKNYLYKPLACVLHSGGLNFGHYTSVVRYGNQWYFCDDTSVITINEQRVKDILDGKIFTIYNTVTKSNVTSQVQSYIYFFELAGESQSKINQLFSEFIQEINKIYISFKNISFA